jgi:hypothetical protein
MSIPSATYMADLCKMRGLPARGPITEAMHTCIRDISSMQVADMRNHLLAMVKYAGVLHEFLSHMRDETSAPTNAADHIQPKLFYSIREGARARFYYVCAQSGLRCNLLPSLLSNIICLKFSPDGLRSNFRCCGSSVLLVVWIIFTVSEKSTG